VSRRLLSRKDRRALGWLAAGVLALGVLGGHQAVTKASAAPDPATGAPGPAAVKAIGFARAQFGKPYVWGGPTAPGTGYGFDCSGLAQTAYAAAGLTIPRTSEAQWAGMVHVASPVPGDLVFFAGADGTPASPGHVGLVVDPARHLMIDAYAPGVPVREETYGLPTSAAGLANPVGYAQWGPS
jgi:cell wall-associated NlpC family hydrolase